jgi:hypothetical protein
LQADLNRGLFSCYTKWQKIQNENKRVSVVHVTTQVSVINLIEPKEQLSQSKASPKKSSLVQSSLTPAFPVTPWERNLATTPILERPLGGATARKMTSTCRR